MSRSSRILLSLVAVAGLTVSSMVISGGASASVSHRPSAASKTINHVFIIMMENTGFNALIGDPNAPWINYAAQHYGVAASYFGVTHPSQPNYIAATSGSLNGVTSDNDATINVRNIVDQLEAKHKTWKAYMQSLADCAGNKLAHACGNAHYGLNLYERKHDPFISYQDVQNSPSRMANIVDLGQLPGDLLTNHVPNYVWISPDQCHDMHGLAATSKSDPCDYSQVQSLIRAGDRFLKHTVSDIMHSHAWRHQNSVIVITWDEADYTGTGFQGFADDSGCCDSVAGQGGGRVLTLAITKSNESHDSHRVALQAYNHFSLLATVERAWRLGCLANTCDTKNVPAMSGLFHSR